MAVEDGTRLGKGNLSLPDVVAQSVGYMGPVFSGTFFIPAIVGLGFAGRGAGIASPFAILLTAIGMLALAWIISRYAKRIHAAGALYDYVGEGFGKPVGLFAGWVYYGGARDAHARHRPRLRWLRQPDLARRPQHPRQLDLVHAAVLDRGLGDLGARRSDLYARAAHPRARLGGSRLRLGRVRDPQGRKLGLLDEAVQPGRVVVQGHHVRHRLRRAHIRRLRVSREPGRGDGRAETQHPARHLLQRACGRRVLCRALLGARPGVRPQRRRPAEELPAALRRDCQSRLRRKQVLGTSCSGWW